MYKQQTLIVSLNFTKIINLFFKSDWLITMLLQGQQRCWPRNMLHLVKSGSATWRATVLQSLAPTCLYSHVWKILVCLISPWLAGSGVFNCVWSKAALQEQDWTPLIHSKVLYTVADLITYSQYFMSCSLHFQMYLCLLLIIPFIPINMNTNRKNTSRRPL